MSPISVFTEIIEFSSESGQMLFFLWLRRCFCFMLAYLMQVFKGNAMLKYVCALALALTLISPIAAKAADPAQNAHAFSFTGADGTPVSLADYRGKVVMIVNTATGCGLAGQFGEMQKLYDTYKDKGFAIIAVPSNDFGGQEPLEAAAAAEKTGKDYGVTYPFVAKTAVSGDAAHPFYVWAGAQNKGSFLSSKPRWNFHKYLVGANGELLASYASTTSPLDKDVIAEIETALLAAQPTP